MHREHGPGIPGMHYLPRPLNNVDWPFFALHPAVMLATIKYACCLQLIGATWTSMNVFVQMKIL